MTEEKTIIFEYRPRKILNWVAAVGIIALGSAGFFIPPSSRNDELMMILGGFLVVVGLLLAMLAIPVSRSSLDKIILGEDYVEIPNFRTNKYQRITYEEIADVMIERRGLTITSIYIVKKAAKIHFTEKLFKRSIRHIGVSAMLFKNEPEFHRFLTELLARAADTGSAFEA